MTSDEEEFTEKVLRYTQEMISENGSEDAFLMSVLCSCATYAEFMGGIPKSQDEIDRAVNTISNVARIFFEEDSDNFSAEKE